MRPFLLSIVLTVTAMEPRVAAAQLKPHEQAEIHQWSPHEIVLTAERDYANPYLNVDLTATFEGPGSKLSVRGFWDGGRTYKFRFTPPIKGIWKYSTWSAPSDAGLVSTGQFEVAGPRSNSPGFLRRDERWPESFVFDDGTRHFMFGTTHYHLLLNARAGDRWQEAIDGAQRYGMTKARISLTPSDSSDKSGGYSKTSPFLDKDQLQLDLAHWQTADRVVGYMHGRGFMADLILFWRKDEKLVSDAMSAADKQYLRYALARYAAYPNVLWCMVNEWNYSTVPREYWNELGQLVRDEDPYGQDGGLLRVHSIHQQTRPDWNFMDQAWPSHAIVQLGVRNRGASARIGDEWAAAGKAGTRFRYGDEWGNHSVVRNWTGKHPVVNDEYGYIGEPQDDSEPKNRDGSFARMTREKHRHAMWGIAAGGGYAAAGDKNDYGGDGRPYFSANWRDTPEYGDIARLIDFFTKRGIEYWRMGPRNDLASGDRTYVLAEPGRQYVVYAATGGSPSLELAAGEYTASQYDPRTGQTTALPDVSGPKRHTLMLPDQQDWVIHVVSKSPRWTTGDVLLDDSLNLRSRGQTSGGQFVTGGGWTPVGPRDRIVWELPRHLAAGRLEVDIKNLDPARQAKVSKSNFLGMWETMWKNGDDEGQARRDHWGLRMGTNYPQLKLKIHTRDACRYEKNLAPVTGGFDPSTTYHFATEWADGRATFSLDGKPFLVWDSPAADPLDALKFIHLGSDTQFDAGSPGSSVAGPVYSNLKVSALEPSK